MLHHLGLLNLEHNAGDLSFGMDDRMPSFWQHLVSNGIFDQ